VSRTPKDIKTLNIRYLRVLTIPIKLPYISIMPSLLRKYGKILRETYFVNIFVSSSKDEVSKVEIIFRVRITS